MRKYIWANRQRMLAVTAACLCMTFSSPLFAGILIDDFGTNQELEVIAIAPPTGEASSFVAAPGDAIGGERDLVVEKTTGGNTDRIRTRANPDGNTLLRHSQESGVQGRTVVIWDGPDGLPELGDIDFTGLGGVDLLDGGNSDAFEIGVEFSDIDGPIHFTVYDADDAGGGTFATATLVVSPVAFLDFEIMELLFSSFSPTGGTLMDIFDSVGAIVMEIDGTAGDQTSWDLDLAFVRTNMVVPEPGTFVVWSLLGLSVCGWGRFRRRK